MPKTLIREAVPLQPTAAPSGKSGRLRICIATPGWGSSGYYSAKVLENAATDNVFPAGTQMFLDHETETERYDRPERSVRDLAAVFTENATWDAEAQMLVSEVQAFGPSIDLLTDEQFATAVGASMRAYAESTTGEAEGRKGKIITNLVEALSVDIVTKAGRGGRILEVLESARPVEVVERAVAHGVAEATANDTRAALDAALREEYGGDKTWVWVRDFDESTVWFSLETPDGSGTYAEKYELDTDGAAIVAGNPTEVRARTEYVPVKASESAGPLPVPAPAGQHHPTQTSKEDTMGTIQVDEAEHGRLAEAAGRATESERRASEAEAREAAAKSELALYKAREAARPAVTKKVGESALPATRKARIVESILTQVRLDESGAANAEELVGITEAAVTEAETEIAEIAEALGHGRVTGFGQTRESAGGATVEDFDNAFKTSQEG